MYSSANILLKRKETKELQMDKKIEKCSKMMWRISEDAWMQDIVLHIADVP